MLKQILYTTLLCLLAINNFIPKCEAVQSNPNPNIFHQNGFSLQINTRGNEQMNWEDYDNYLVKFNEQTEKYHYAELNTDDDIVMTPYIVGAVEPQSVGLTKGKKPKKNNGIPNQDFNNGTNGNGNGNGNDNGNGNSNSNNNNNPSNVATTGTLKNLVVLVRFADHVARPLPSVADLDILFNSPVTHPTIAPTGSVIMAYQEMSYNQLTIDSTIANWVTVSNPEAYYGNGKPEKTVRSFMHFRPG